MARFDEDGLFDRLPIKGALTTAMLARLAHRIAEFHKGAAVDRSPSAAVRMASVLAINESALATTTVFAFEEVEAFNATFRRCLANLSDLLDLRARAGKVRRCHGDLHLRNICLIDGEPTLFDCLEFDEAMATTDVLYDLAFLLMDLWHRGLHTEANLVFNRYLDECNEEDGLPLISFLMAVRAAVRAHVTATQASDAGDGAAARRSEARSYFDLALKVLEFRPSRIIAVGGFSGSGKSTVAAVLAPHVGPPPGARILATDRIRKQIFNVPAETRLPMEAYRTEALEKSMPGSPAGPRTLRSTTTVRSPMPSSTGPMTGRASKRVRCPPAFRSWGFGSMPARIASCSACDCGRVMCRMRLRMSFAPR